jgi:PAS domain S-box-containing protein
VSIASGQENRDLMHKRHDREIHVLQREPADNESFWEVVDGTRDWIWEIDTEERYTFSSDAVKGILGYSPSEIIGRHFYDFFPEEERETLKAESLRLIRKKAPFIAFRNRNVHKDGHVVILETTGFPILGREGELLGYRGADRDVTAQVKAAEALRESEERFRTLVEAMPDLIFVIDEHGRFLEAYGADPNCFYLPPEEFIGKRIAEVMPPETSSKTLPIIQRVLEEGISQTIEYSLDLRDGKHWFSARISHLPPRNGVRRVLSVTADITNRITAEEKVKTAKEELERVLNAMGEGLVVMDAENRMTQLNRKACELFGYSKEEILGRDYTFWSHPDFADNLKQELNKRATGKKSTYEALYKRKDGSSFWARVNAVPIIDEQGVYRGSIGCLSDITEEKKVEEEFRRLHEFNEKLIQVASVWINVVDLDGKVTLWNREAERISGYSREEVIGHNKIWEWLYPDPEYRNAIWQGQQQIRVEDESSRMVETTIRTKAGEGKVIAWFGTPLFDENGTSTGWVVVGHDVTEQKSSEQRLQSYVATVARLSEEKDRFLSTASHELRTPLAIIRGFADLLSRDETLNAEQQAKVERIKTQSERLDTLLAALLDISRIEAKKSNLTLQEIDLAPVLQRVIDALKPQMDAKEQRFVYARRSVRVYADPIAVEQVLINLLTNAIAYTPRKGRIAIDLHNMDEMVRIDISDTGIGITAEEQKEIFNEFYRSRAAHEINPDGTGLGLSIVKRLVEEMNGSIWVRSSGRGRGSTFSITLPPDHPH